VAFPFFRQRCSVVSKTNSGPARFECRVDDETKVFSAVRYFVARLLFFRRYIFNASMEIEYSGNTRNVLTKRRKFINNVHYLFVVRHLRLRLFPSSIRLYIAKRFRTRPAFFVTNEIAERNNRTYRNIVVSIVSNVVLVYKPDIVIHVAV